MKRYILTAFALAIASVSAPAAPVYYNTATDTLNTTFYSTGAYQQIGDILTLGGVDRALTAAYVQFFNNGDTGSFSAILRFWTVGGPVGAQIGGDYQVDNVAIDATSSLTVSFSLPHLVVPDNLIVTIQVLNPVGDLDLGLNLFDPPTVGSSDNTNLIVNDGTFQTSTTPDGLGNLYLGLDAVPEPSTGVMLGGIAILALIARRRSASAL